MSTPSHGTISRINQAIRLLPEVDRQRVLCFTLGIVSDREGKRAKRRDRFSSKPIDSWRIGNG